MDVDSAFCKNVVIWGREAGKIVRFVTRGGGPEYGVGVGVDIEVGSAGVVVRGKT